MLWVAWGQNPIHYPTPQSFLEEARRLGVSRKITAVPRGFRPGQTWTILGHSLGHHGDPGIIGAFRADEIQYVVDGSETDDELERMVGRGITPVRVSRGGKHEESVEEHPPSPTTMEEILAATARLREMLGIGGEDA